MGEGAEVPEVGSSVATGSSEERMAGAVGLEDLPIPLLPEAEQPVRQGVRVQNMRRSLSGAGNEVQRQAVRHMRAIWPLQTRKLLQRRRGQHLKYL